jgi:hypothetical protein
MIGSFISSTCGAWIVDPITVAMTRSIDWLHFHFNNNASSNSIEVSFGVIRLQMSESPSAGSLGWGLPIIMMMMIIEGSIELIVLPLVQSKNAQLNKRNIMTIILL